MSAASSQAETTALAEIERAMQIIDRHMPSCRFKVRWLHDVTQFVAEWTWRLSRITCRAQVTEATVPSSQAEDAAVAAVEQAMAILDRSMPTCRFKVSCLHRLTLFIADWKWRLSRSTCRACGAVFHIGVAEARWHRERDEAQPTRCRSCRRERRLHAWRE